LLSGEGDGMLATGAGTVHDYKVRVEQGLVKKAEDMLTAVLGPGRATIRVSAVVDMNSVSTITETYDPTTKVATKEEITNNSETPPSGAGQQAAGGTKKDETISTEYQIGKTVKQQVILPGEIRSLSVAAFVDLSVADANGTGATGQAALIMEVTEVEEIIRNALGLKTTDSLKVVHARFHQPPATEAEEEPSTWPRYLALARQLSLGIMAVCALIVFRIFSRARGKAMATNQAQQLPEGSGAGGGLLSAGSSASEPIVLRRQITHAIRNNPEQVREMFLSWIEEKE
jgi:flagellar M-ring protein FliF